MNIEWLFENADYPIKYSLTQNDSYIDKVLENIEVKAWIDRLADRVKRSDLSGIHGSHDYRYENIIGKCFILGLNAKIPQFNLAMRFFIDFINKHTNEKQDLKKYQFDEMDKHITNIYDEKLTFGKIYKYRDYETLLACYMPFLGYAGEESVQYIANKRVNIIYEFTKQGRYDVYRSDLDYSGAKKEWKPYIIEPELYKDGNIALPSMHDLILFAGMYPYFNHDMKDKVETTVRWLFSNGYAIINRRLYYYAPDDPNYKSKAINSKVWIPDLREISQANTSELRALLYLCFILSHFKEARKWVSEAVSYLEQYKTESGCYIFPKEMIIEKKDNYVIEGGHMNVGENKKNKKYTEILSTYWMKKITDNLT